MNIVTFTGNRAEYYLLRPLLRRLLSEKKFNLKFIISGDIVKENDSQTLKDIQKDQIKIDKLIKIPNKYESHSEKIGYLCIEIPNW